MKKCKYCQSEIDEKAKICPNCRKKQKPHIIRWIILAVCSLLIVSCFFGEESIQKDENEKCYATLEKFNQIENGMTYQEVKNIIGCDGTLSSDVGDEESYNLKTYYWYGKDNISNMVLMFENDVLNGKNQIGLDN